MLDRDKSTEQLVRATHDYGFVRSSFDRLVQAVDRSVQDNVPADVVLHKNDRIVTVAQLIYQLETVKFKFCKGDRAEFIKQARELLETVSGQNWGECLMRTDMSNIAYADKRST